MPFSFRRFCIIIKGKIRMEREDCIVEEEKKSTCVQEKFNKGAVLVQRGGSNNRMAVLTRGTVEASYRNMKLLLQPGAIMDVTAVDRTECMMDYTAAEDGKMTVFEYSTLDSFRTFLGQEEKNRSTLINGCMQQVKQLYGAREAGMELLERVCGSLLILI